MFKSVIDKNKPNLLFLHGWATTWESLFPPINQLKTNFNIYAPNLPHPKNKVLTLDDYCQFVLGFIETEKISKPIIIGHSLGGAITTKIAVDHPKLASKIILMSAASIRHQLPQPWLFFQKFSPLLRPFRSIALKISRLDAADYTVLKTKIEKDTFRNLIHYDQSATLHQIKIPTLILWGDDDTSTFLSDGKLIHSLIKDSIFKSFPKTGHFFYLDHPTEISELIANFATK